MCEIYLTIVLDKKATRMYMWKIQYLKSSLWVTLLCCNVGSCDKNRTRCGGCDSSTARDKLQQIVLEWIPESGVSDDELSGEIVYLNPTDIVKKEKFELLAVSGAKIIVGSRDSFQPLPTAVIVSLEQSIAETTVAYIDTSCDVPVYIGMKLSFPRGYFQITEILLASGLSINVKDNCHTVNTENTTEQLQYPTPAFSTGTQNGMHCFIHISHTPVSECDK